MLLTGKFPEKLFTSLICLQVNYFYLEVLTKLFFNSQIDVNLFITVLEVFKPDIVQCLCDTTPASGQTEKRIRKSVDRTLKFLDKFIEERGRNKVGKWQAMLQFSVLLVYKEANLNYFKTMCTWHLFVLLSTFCLWKTLKWDWACPVFISCSLVFKIEVNFYDQVKVDSRWVSNAA